MVECRRLSHIGLYGELLHPSGAEYCITIGVRSERREMVVAGLGRSEREFSERDRDELDLVRPAPEDALRDAPERERLVPALAANPPPGEGAGVPVIPARDRLCLAGLQREIASSSRP
jgi:hypothetical protein